MVKRVLMIAFHFPPLVGSSGLQRTLAFSRYLPEYGWEPIVLTVHPRAYAQKGLDQVADIPAGTRVARAFGLDTARHLAIKGSYSRLMALPDRWATWWLGGVPHGLALIRRYKPAVLWSTYPIATAHAIGLTLNRVTGLPWVADFRDSMTEDYYPSDPTMWRSYRWIEAQTVKRSSRVVFTAPGTSRMYAERYPQCPVTSHALIENGFDEFAFRNLPDPEPAPPVDRPLTLVHSGIVYPSERDPSHLFDALAELRDRGQITADGFRVVFRGCGHDEAFRQMLKRRSIEDLVALAPAIPYREALSEMMNADGLLVLQASNCNHQIPAKIYEYLRTRRPILGLTDPKGDTAGVLRQAGINTIAPLNSSEAISRLLMDFDRQVRGGRQALPSESVIQRSSRRGRTAELARLLDQVMRDEAKRKRYP